MLASQQPKLSVILSILLYTFVSTLYTCSWCFHVGDDYSGVDILIADVNDEESLMSMCSQAHLVLNCVGPVSL